MHRQPLLDLLNVHRPFDADEAMMLTRIQQFVKENEDCFERTLLIGHVTGSAWVINENSSQVLLLHHAKLDRWLQPGGHCDGDANVLRVALREAQEESGLSSLQAVTTQVFDVDVHWIPGRSVNGDFVPGHWHYDVRFLLRASDKETLKLNHEVKAVRWVALTERTMLSEASLRRMAIKTSL